MIKKEKILYSYLSNIIEDENPNTIFVNTTRDISKLVKRIEKLNIQSLQIGPDIEQISNENFDLFIICLLYTSPSPRDFEASRMPSSA